MFRLSALRDPDVVEWMDETYPADLSKLEAESQQTNFDNIQSEIIAEQLAGLSGRMTNLESKLDKILHLLARRTAVLSPSKGVDDVVFTSEHLRAV